MDELRLTYAAIAERLRISHDAARMLVRRRGWQRTLPNRRGAPAIVIVPEEELAAEQWRTQEEATFPDVPGTSRNGLANEAEERAERAERIAERAEQRAEVADADRRAADQRADEAQKRADAADADRRAAIGLAEQTVALLKDAEARVAAGHEHADMLRDRLNAMQEQLSDAHAALEAAASADARAQQAEASRDAERTRAERAEQGREADRTRADGLQAKLDDMQGRLTARQEVVDAAEAIRKADDARLARSRWARLRAAWRGE